MPKTSSNVSDGAQILLVDDQPTNLDVLCRLLELEGYDVLLAPTGQVALNSATRVIPDLILLDVTMPEMDGYEVCRRLKENPKTETIPVIFITGRDLKEDIVAGFEAGGVDYITKPIQEEEVLIRVRTHVRMNKMAGELAAKNKELEEKNKALEEGIAQRRVLKGQLAMISDREIERWGLEGFIGKSPTVQRIVKEIRLMQENIATTVLITGESGTGKELIARAIHFGSARKDGPFVPINCAAVPSELVESLLFGHTRGAFTGAAADKTGYFEMAHGGTLFLDEIGDMPLELQGKLLRVLEDREVWRVGANRGRDVDVRVLAATNANLQERIRENTLRQDLYYRLARFTVEAPPLCERRDDIPLLAQHFLEMFTKEMGREPPALTLDAVDRLTSHDFPGNVRELKNVIERALIQSDGGEILSSHLHLTSTGPPATAPTLTYDTEKSELPLDLEGAAARAQSWVVQRAMEANNGNITEAARLLGTSRNKIYRVLSKE